MTTGVHLDIDGCVNFRDAGGWEAAGGEMRTGLLYRSDDPVRLTAVGRAAVDALHLAAVVDLRQEAQFRRRPGFVEPARTFHRPLVDKVIDLDNPPELSDPSHIADLYVEMIERSRQQIADVLNIVGERIGDGPVLVHCAFGKDRTGLIVAMVQAAIGVGADDIVADYTASHQPAQRRLNWLLTEPLHDDPPIHKPPAYLFAAPPEAMRSLLDQACEQYGSLLGWVEHFNLDAATIDRLRAALVKETP